MVEVKYFNCWDFTFLLVIFSRSDLNPTWLKYVGFLAEKAPYLPMVRVRGALVSCPNDGSISSEFAEILWTCERERENGYFSGSRVKTFKRESGYFSGSRVKNYKSGRHREWYQMWYRVDVGCSLKWHFFLRFGWSRPLKKPCSFTFPERHQEEIPSSRHLQLAHWLSGKQLNPTFLPWIFLYVIMSLVVLFRTIMS